MDETAFRTPAGVAVPAVTATEMHSIDRAVVEEIGLSLLMMMEHAGRGLAEAVQERAPEGPVAVLAGGGGNGGGGLCAARHLANHGREVSVVLDREPEALEGPPARQHRVLGDAAEDATREPEAAIGRAAVVVDALVGYSLRGVLRGSAAELAALANAARAEIVSLDVPSGMDATTGERHGEAVAPAATLTLALPKTGLRAVEGALELADIGIPERGYELAGLPVASPFAGDVWRLRLEPRAT